MRKLFLLFTGLLHFAAVFAQFAPEHDPHRGMYVDRFWKAKWNSSTEVDPALSILGVDQNRDGIFEKEDTLLRYASRNHITYLALYDIFRILGRNYSAWNENTRRLENLEAHLCRFIRKAKRDYGVTQVGLIAGSASFFDSLSNYLDDYPPTGPLRLSRPFKDSPHYDSVFRLAESSFAPQDTRYPSSEFIKSCLRIAQFNDANDCGVQIDAVNMEDEFWGNCAVNVVTHTTLLQAMDAFRDTYNQAHPDIPIITEDYVGFLGNCPINSTVQMMDGCNNCAPCAGCNNPHESLVDRILYSQQTGVPANFALAEQHAYELPETQDSTDFHALLYAESTFTGGGADYLGVWFPQSPAYTIFYAEALYYKAWRNNPYTTFGSPDQNNVQRGGTMWFAANHMIGHLEDPKIVQNTGPYCTMADSQRVSVTYYGPTEPGIAYDFRIVRADDQRVVYPPDGSSVSGSTLPYEPSVAGSTESPSIRFSDTAYFPPIYLPAGDYRMELKLDFDSASAAEFTATYPLLIDSRPRMHLMKDSVFCDGQYTYLVASPGGTSYVWHLNGNPYVATGSQHWLKATEDGEYWCAVTGGAGTCSGNTDTVRVRVKAMPSVFVNAVCNGNGTVTLKTDMRPAQAGTSETAGIGGLTYQWNNGETTSQITVTPTSTTTYRVVITDPYSGCSLYRECRVAAPPQQIFTPSITVNTSPSAPCAHNGSLTAWMSPSWYQGQVSYLWNTGQTTPTITGLAPGEYIVAMSYWSNACTYYDTIQLGTLPGNAPVVMPTIQAASCQNRNDGAINLVCTNGNPPFTFFWRDLPASGSHDSRQEDQTLLYPGVYTVLITDAGGCEFPYTFTVPAAQGPISVAAGTIQPVTGCPDDATGSASVVVTGGTAPYQYLWNDPAAQTTDTALNLQAGSYFVTVTDASSCSASAYVSIPGNALPFRTYATSNHHPVETCQPGNDGVLELAVDGGDPPYAAVAPWTISNDTLRLIGPAGTYSLHLTDSAGCPYDTTFIIRSADAPVVTLSASGTSCAGCSDGFILLSGSSSFVTVLWTPSLGTLQADSIAQLPGGLYTVCIENDSGCTSCDTISVPEDPLGVLHGRDAVLSFNVYPNPTTGPLQIGFPAASDGSFYQYEVMEASGKNLFRGSFEGKPPFRLDLSSLSPGTYLLELTSPAGESSRRLVLRMH